MYVASEKIHLSSVEGEDGIEIGREIETNYGEKPISVEKYAEATASSRVYRVGFSDGSVWVAKYADWHADTKAYDAVYRTTDQLKLLGLPIVTAKKTVDGACGVPTEKGFLLLLDHVEGEHFPATELAVSEMGRALGRFHAVGLQAEKEGAVSRKEILSVLPTEKPYEESRAMYEKEIRPRIVDGHSCTIPDVCRYVAEHVDLLDHNISLLDTVDFAGSSSGLVYNDFNINNVLFCPDGTFSGYIDPDQIGIDPYIWDVANGLTSVLSNVVPAQTVTQDVAIKNFISAYRSEFSLPLADYDLLLASALRWDMLRILRSLRRHYFENDRFPLLTKKIKDRLISRLEKLPELYSSTTNPEWKKGSLEK